MYEVPLDYGNCPSCNISLDGDSIWEHFYKEEGSEEEADRISKMYGATRTKGRWGRAIGIYDIGKDRTVRWLCPFCKHEWKR